MNRRARGRSGGACQPSRVPLPFPPSSCLARLGRGPRRPRHPAPLSCPRPYSLSTYGLGSVRGRPLQLSIPTSLRSPARRWMSSAAPRASREARAQDSLMAAPAKGPLQQVRGRGTRPREQRRWGRGAQVSVPLSQGREGGAFNSSRVAGLHLLVGFRAAPRPGFVGRVAVARSTQVLQQATPPAPRSWRHPSPPSPRHAHWPQAHLRRKESAEIPKRRRSAGMGRRQGLKEAVTSLDHRPGEGQRPQSRPPRERESQLYQSGALEIGAAGSAAGPGGATSVAGVGARRSRRRAWSLGLRSPTC